MKSSIANRAGSASRSITGVRRPGITGAGKGRVAFLALVAGLLACATSGAQSVYKYRDDSGQWVFTDRRPAAELEFEQAPRVAAAAKSPRVTVRRSRSANGVDLIASNDCQCPVEVGIVLTRAGRTSPGPGEVVSAVVPAGSEARIASVQPDDPDAAADFDYEFGFVYGDPAAEHRPPAPYRPPFAAGREFIVSQAWPDRITHDTPDSRYAIDIAMPAQSGVYAARAGTVMQVAYSNFRGGVDRDRYGAQANLIRILHDDGTFAVYAHLSWDSIRVHPGQRVARGEYIGDSGNTGFSTGPHLHFVVVRNSGLRTESVPVVFAAGPGRAVTPRTGMTLKNP